MEFHNEKPIYLQIAAVLQEQIVKGQLKAGDKLPSVREGSVLFEVSALTMQRAMQRLETEGVIVSRKGIGYFVKEECVSSLQAKLTGERAAEFVRTMKNCGLTLEDIHSLIDTLWEELADGNE